MQKAIYVAATRARNIPRQDECDQWKEKKCDPSDLILKKGRDMACSVWEAVDGNDLGNLPQYSYQDYLTNFKHCIPVKYRVAND